MSLEILVKIIAYISFSSHKKGFVFYNSAENSGCFIYGNKLVSSRMFFFVTQKIALNQLENHNWTREKLAEYYELVMLLFWLTDTKKERIFHEPLLGIKLGGQNPSQTFDCIVFFFKRAIHLLLRFHSNGHFQFYLTCKI